MIKREEFLQGCVGGEMREFFFLYDFVNGKLCNFGTCDKMIIKLWQI